MDAMTNYTFLLEAAQARRVASCFAQGEDRSMTGPDHALARCMR